MSESSIDSRLSMLLINHCRNCSGASSPEIAIRMCAKSESRMSMRATLTETRLREEDLRTLFNNLTCWDRAMQQEFLCCLRYCMDATPGIFPPGTKSITLACYHPVNPERFIVHFYWHPNLGLQASQLLDPKDIIVDGTHYFI